MKDNKQDWLYSITPKRGLFELNFKEIWQYRDLLKLWIKRDIVTVYKQTILGPLWYLIQPLFTSLIFTLIFNNLANINTGFVPSFLFNLTGITAWNYFKECLTGTSDTFKKHAAIFGKVYFPRVIMPLATTISNLLKFAIQLSILVVFYLYYLYQGAQISVNNTLFLVPIYIIMMALLGLGMGMIISTATTKYRDLLVLVGFGVNLLMYISAVPFPLSELKLKQPQYAWLVEYNPLAQIIEGFRYMILNTGTFSWFGFVYALIISILIFLIGLVIFNKTEKTFIDSI